MGHIYMTRDVKTEAQIVTKYCESRKDVSWETESSSQNKNICWCHRPKKKSPTTVLPSCDIENNAFLMK